VGTSGAGASARRDRARDSAWDQGASVVGIVGAALDRIPGIEVLHDRRIPGSCIMTIDHLAVAPAGVFVVAAKLSGWRLQPAERRRATRPAERTEHWHEEMLLRLGTRARAVARLLADAPVPVAPALCLVDAQGSEATRTFMLDRVWIGTPPALPELVGHPGLLDGESMRTVAARLDARLA
jgi:Nuclease-related domain